MAYSNANVVKIVQTNFPEDRWAFVLALRDTYGTESYEFEQARVRMAILNLSIGGEENCTST